MPLQDGRELAVAGLDEFSGRKAYAALAVPAGGAPS
jgi:hypothetical protein